MNVLTTAEQALLRAVIDRIYPADTHPSATGLGADGYILPMLEGDARPIREMIRCGAGVGFLPGFLAEPDVTDRRLVCVLPDVVQRGGTLTLLHSNTRFPSTALTLFRDFLVEWFARR